MMKRLLIMALLLLSACAKSAAPEEVASQYLQKRVGGDVAGITALACAEWEEDAQLEAEALANREGKLEGLTCQQVGKNGVFTNVQCEGEIFLSYQGEVRQQPIRIVYQLKQEDGDWKVCGEAD